MSRLQAARWERLHRRIVDAPTFNADSEMVPDLIQRERLYLSKRNLFDLEQMHSIGF